MERAAETLAEHMDKIALGSEAQAEASTLWVSEHPNHGPCLELTPKLQPLPGTHPQSWPLRGITQLVGPRSVAFKSFWEPSARTS